MLQALQNAYKYELMEMDQVAHSHLHLVPSI